MPPFAIGRCRRIAPTPEEASLNDESPWRPRGIEVRGRAEAIADPEPLIRIHPARIVSWGLDTGAGRSRSARNATPPTPNP